MMPIYSKSKLLAGKLFLLLAILCLGLISLWPVSGYSASNKNSSIQLTPEEAAWLEASPEIRVAGDIQWPPFNFSEDGVPQGYSIGYIEMLAKKVGLNVKYVTGPVWNEFLEMMKAGTLDVMLDIVKTPERQEYLLYTPPYVSNPNVILSRSASAYKSVEELFGKTVAVTAGSFYEEVLERDYPQINILGVADTFETIKAVSFLNADAAFGETAAIRHLMKKHLTTGLVISGELKMGDPELALLHIATRKELPHLASILRKGMAAVSEDEKQAIHRLWVTEEDKVDSVDQTIDLSEAEKQWLKQHSVISVVDDFAWPPFTFLDEDGNMAGLASSYIRLFGERLGVEFRPKFGRSWDQALDEVKSRQSDTVPLLIPTKERETFLSFTKPVISFPLVLATRNDSSFIDSLDDLSGKRVGVVDGYLNDKRLKVGYPAIEVVLYGSVSEGLEAVDGGEIDAFAASLGVIEYERSRLGLDNIKVAAPTPFVDNLSFGIRKDWPELVSMINKVLDSITDREKTAIKKNLDRDYIYSWYTDWNHSEMDRSDCSHCPRVYYFHRDLEPEVEN
ncbi:transporter substrate-binding domain-containing protein [Solemya velum gill symbiont]|uniref:transporter substrate-binding domain-containing protein n=1 Tax=Solemya velum gill symbiont TaxID=2340 RepID=UPI0009980691|nr:transporter substrate-binding domain-containing protein [Solemya velum gill symbiont]OOY57555.1 hypothetical protein BOV99_00660 [Solemya velum gill symbiont]OOY58579.1 hypothetical protein BOW00_00660 [Solemya velum gill symbiont]OOY71202.1 hypothetical protein BOW07_00660 [Solemya velum gill symbiont]OOY80946.1 hypothetical protein BOW11_02185 [Solemya velum gill symbiont]OOY87641.1 hypothetical protein BOW14_03995 [Solemya velum gill symbiont]